MKKKLKQIKKWMRRSGMSSLWVLAAVLHLHCAFFVADTTKDMIQNLAFTSLDIALAVMWWWVYILLDEINDKDCLIRKQRENIDTLYKEILIHGTDNRTVTE